jgi:hypothetical protein
MELHSCINALIMHGLYMLTVSLDRLLGLSDDVHVRMSCFCAGAFKTNYFIV